MTLMSLLLLFGIRPRIVKPSGKIFEKDVSSIVVYGEPSRIGLTRNSVHHEFNNRIYGTDSIQLSLNNIEFFKSVLAGSDSGKGVAIIYGSNTELYYTIVSFSSTPDIISPSRVVIYDHPDGTIRVEDLIRKVYYIIRDEYHIKWIHNILERKEFD